MGRMLSHYEVLEEIGAGGMGDVYRARDTRLSRDVAIKVLPGEVSADPKRLRRFDREAKTLAALNHPNIVVVHSVEEAEGLHFLTMELVEGRTLGELIPSGGMSLERFFDLAVPLADAVAAAHSRGVIHRDLKPANVMVSRDGRVKVLDFGLARQVAGDEDDLTALPTETLEHLTREGQVMGTVPYMAPEQLQGRPVTRRSDIFSLGALLYQMATGERPFRGETGADLVSAVLRDRPLPLSEVRSELPRHLGRIVSRCLAKDPERRIQTALDVRNELEEIRSETRERAAEAPAEDAPSIVVLPFVNMYRDEESDFFVDGLTEEIINALTGIEGLRVTSRTSAFRYKGQEADIRRIGRELQVDTALEGSVRRAGERIRVTTQLIDVADGFHRWSERYDRRLKDVFEVQDDIARAVAEELRGALVVTDRRAVSRPTESMEAYDLYLKGRYHWEQQTPEGFRAAVNYFEEAKSVDPQFAHPRAWLAVAYRYLTMLGYARPADFVSKGREEADRAVELAPDLAEAHEALSLYLQYHDWDWKGTEREYRRAMELNPGDATARAWYALFLVRFLDRQDEAIAQARKALQMDPVSFEANTFYNYVLVFARRAEEALELVDRTMELHPGVALAHAAAGFTLTAVGRLDDGIEAFREGLEINPVDPFCLGALLFTLGHSDRQGEARETLVELIEKRTKEYFPAVQISLGFLGLGELEEALRWLELAIDEREPMITFISCWPVWDPLRDHPRFQARLREMDLP